MLLVNALTLRGEFPDMMAALIFTHIVSSPNFALVFLVYTQDVCSHHSVHSLTSQLLNYSIITSFFECT